MNSHEERPRVLVVDDEKLIRDILADFLAMEGYIVRTAEDGAAAMAELNRARYDLVISDMKMPRMGGIELLEQLGRTAPHVVTVIMTGFGTVETAIEAMKRGAYDYILKPFKIEEVIRIVQHGLEKQRLAAENMRLKEAISLHKVSEAIAASLSLEEVLATVAESAFSELGSDWISTWLDDGQGHYTERQHMIRAGLDVPADISTTASGDIYGQGTGLTVPALMDLLHAQPSPSSFGHLDPGVFERHFAHESTLIEQGARSLRFFAQVPALPPLSLMAVPLRMKQRLLGWITVATFTRNRRFDGGQYKLLQLIGSRAAAAIENARLYEDLQATFQQTIEGLAKAIDRMDRYTAGHSGRVSIYAGVLARRMGLSPDMVTIVQHAALMHDIGKIGCVLNLNKPGKLSQEEYEIFKKHPGYGRDILEPIKFLHPLVPGVHFHHEMWNGRGYPLGLQGNDIPLIARIISVADTYDAMTSDRAYRRALPHDVAVAEIERCAGSQFDPDIAQLFVEAIEDFREEQAARGEHIPE
ncbi:MAG: response regulator [Myxococcales bacterium]|nr:response regulator [Polyangiaceae bacterium]MDW8251176.1 response regulator [Myxococcales bacterium]